MPGKLEMDLVGGVEEKTGCGCKRENKSQKQTWSSPECNSTNQGSVYGIEESEWLTWISKSLKMMARDRAEVKGTSQLKRSRKGRPDPVSHSTENGTGFTSTAEEKG